MKLLRSHIKLVLLLSFLVLCLSSSDLIGQDNTVKSDAKREEIQRYVGYETLIYRYLSLPYDVTMNNNERGTGFLDIGYLLLMFLPILVMIKFRHRWSVLVVVPLLMLIMFIVSTSNSFLFNNTARTMEVNQDGATHFPITSDTPLNDRIIRTYFNINNQLYKPFKAIGESISGQKDSITYPLIILLFIGIFSLWMYLGRSSSRVPWIFIVSIFLLFCFYWFILSPGIVWYGFLGLLLSTVVLLLLTPGKNENAFVENFGKYSFYGLAGVWILIAMISRMSNITPGSPNDILGKTMQNPVAMQYAAGNFDEDLVINMFYPGTSQVLDMMNENKNKLVYRIGTSFSYFIENNHERVMMDNQLQFFNNLTKVYTDKREIAAALKASNFGYFILDLNTPTLDNTPEQSLTKKYQKAVNFLYNNPNVRLLATNRVITKNDTGDQRYYDMFGDQVVGNGTFAIYEIL